MVFHNISSKTRGNVFFRENHLELFLILHYDVDETLQKRGRQQVNKITETYIQKDIDMMKDVRYQ